MKFYNNIDMQGLKVLNAENLQLKMQVSSLPEASAEQLGKIYQFIGTTTENYVFGRFYTCVQEESSYIWKEVTNDSNNSPSPIITTITGDGATTSFEVAHNFGTLYGVEYGYPNVEVYNSSGEKVEMGVTHSSNDLITITVDGPIQNEEVFTVVVK